MERKKQITLYATYIAAVVVLMDLTSVNIALPSISRQLDMSMNQVSWILMVSMLSASSFALVSGKFTMVFGPKRVMIVGFSIFVLGTIGSFLAKSFTTLIVIRFLQGFGESLLYVVGPAYIRQFLPSEKQQSAFGIWMACTGIGIALGPVTGGMLVANYSWNTVFLVNLPLAIVGLGMMLGIKRIISETGEFKSKPDFYGAVLSFLFMAGFIFSLNQANELGLIHPYILISFGLAVVFMFLFIRREKLFHNPIFDIKLFSIKNFNLTVLGFFLYFLVNVGSRFLRPFYFENGRHLTTEVSGILMMVSPVIMILISPMAKRLSHHIKVKYLCVGGNALLAISMFMFANWNSNTSLLFIIISMILLGIGMGLYYPTSSFVGMASLQTTKSGMGSAAISTSKSLGKLMGVLVFGLLFTALLSSFPDSNLELAFQGSFGIGSAIALIATLLSFSLKSKV